MKNKIFRSIIKKNFKGNVIKLINETDNYSNIKGEIYLSKIGKNKIKAWKKHKRANLNLFIIKGKVKFIIIESNNIFKEFILNSKNNRLFIKKNTIFGFQNLYKDESIILSLSNIKYDKTESLNYPLKEIKYKW